MEETSQRVNEIRSKFDRSKKLVYTVLLILLNIISFLKGSGILQGFVCKKKEQKDLNELT